MKYLERVLEEAGIMKVEMSAGELIHLLKNRFDLCYMDQGVYFNILSRDKVILSLDRMYSVKDSIYVSPLNLNGIQEVYDKVNFELDSVKELIKIIEYRDTWTTINEYIDDYMNGDISIGHLLYNKKISLNRMYNDNIRTFLNEVLVRNYNNAVPSGIRDEDVPLFSIICCESYELYTFTTDDRVSLIIASCYNHPIVRENIILMEKNNIDHINNVFIQNYNKYCMFDWKKILSDKYFDGNLLERKILSKERDVKELFERVIRCKDLVSSSSLAYKCIPTLISPELYDLGDIINMLRKHKSFTCDGIFICRHVPHIKDILSNIIPLIPKDVIPLTSLAKEVLDYFINNDSIYHLICRDHLMMRFTGMQYEHGKSLEKITDRTIRDYLYEDTVEEHGRLIMFLMELFIPYINIIEDSSEEVKESDRLKSIREKVNKKLR